MLNILEDFDLDMPIVLDWEIPVPEAEPVVEEIPEFVMPEEPVTIMVPPLKLPLPP